MTLLAYIVAALIIPALALAAASTRYDLEGTPCPDVRFDSEIDREEWRHIERCLYRLSTKSLTRKQNRGYAVVQDHETGRALSRTVTRAALKWYELTGDPMVVALDVLSQCCDLSWDWRPADGGYYEMHLTN